MATADVQAPPAEIQPAVPDYLSNPNAVLGDKDAHWRYGRAPDYSKTRKFYEETKQSNHVAGSLPELVQNLVKNWEVEASFKPRLSDWRTIDHANYTFAINGGPPQTAEHMLNVGTYNAIIAPNQYYSPANSDFASSHKTFKRMMPHFAWEVLEVYSGPPQVAFRWRHWGQMKSDYVGFNDKAEKITAKAHGGQIDIQGVTVAKVDDAVRLQSVETWFDPLEMFRQIAPNGIVNKEIVEKKVESGTPPATTTAVNNDNTHHHDAPANAAETRHDLALLKSQNANQSTSTSHPGGDGEEESAAADDKAAATDSIAATQEPPRTPSEDSSAWEHISTPSSSSPKQSIYSSAVNGAEEDRLQSQPTGPSSSPELTNIAEIPSTRSPDKALPQQPSNDNITPEESTTEAAATPNKGSTTDPLETFLAQPSSVVHPIPHDMEKLVQPAPGDAVAAKPESEEVRATYEEMSRVTGVQCPFLMNRE